MTEETKLTIEILNLCVSFLTPILVIVAGLMISKKIEKNKLEILKEKEWQVKWADLFFKHATDFNDSLTIIFNKIRTETTVSKETSDVVKSLSQQLLNMNWNIQNYARFSKTYGGEVLKKQSELMLIIARLMNEGKCDLEEAINRQFEYNEAVKKAHSEILKMT